MTLKNFYDYFYDVKICDHKMFMMR